MLLALKLKETECSCILKDTWNYVLYFLCILLLSAFTKKMDGFYLEVKKRWHSLATENIAVLDVTLIVCDAEL